MLKAAKYEAEGVIILISR